MGAEVAFTAVTLPGRESRRDEPRHVDAETCVRALADELDELLRRPHVLLGHSMGAILAYLVWLNNVSHADCVRRRRLSSRPAAPHTDRRPRWICTCSAITSWPPTSHAMAGSRRKS